MAFSLLLSILAAAIGWMLSGCSGGNAKEHHIGVVQCSSDPWRWATNDEIERELLFHDNATVEIRSADDDADQQINDIRYFLDKDIDLLIVNPVDADKVTPAIKEAFDRGIPVVTFDRRVNGDCYTAHLEVDNSLIGIEAGEYAISLLPVEAQILEIMGDTTLTSATGRHRGFAEVIAKDPGKRIVATAYARWNPDTAARMVDSILTRDPGIDLIYSHSDAMAIAAAEVVSRHGLDGITILGIDGAKDVGIKAVADSVIDATFLYPTYGHLLLQTALAILDGKPYEREVILPPAPAVDLSNAGILMQQEEMIGQQTQMVVRLKEMVDDYWAKYSTQTTLLYSAILIMVLLLLITFLFIRLFWQRGRHQQALLEKNRQLELERDKQKELYDRLDKATSSKLVFFTNVSHDLRTPLTLIAEPVEQLSRADYLTPRDKSLVGLASRNVRILRRLIDQILDFRKYENGRLDLNLAESDFRQLIADWTASFNELARKHDIRLSTDISQAGPTTAAVDVEKLERVMFNIISNAFKATPPKGEITVACSCDDKAINISVTDTGCGIPQADLSRIFDRFYQGDKVKAGGSGIGLALTRAFVELHGGTISVESEVGHGSCFRITLPVTHCAGSAYKPSEPASATSSAEALDLCDTADHDEPKTIATFDESKPLLLAIDDNREILTLVTDLLSGEYNILTATNGQQGVKLAAKYTPDIIICDVMMPVMDGLQCCAILKSEVATSHIPVLMLTACSLDEQRLKGYESGADAYIPKPFSGDMLAARCRNLVANRRRIRDLYSNPAAVKSRTAATGVASADIQPSSPTAIDSDFYAEFLRIVATEMADRDFGVEKVASMMHLGTSQFSRKIKALTNYTPVELIRNLRLKEARRLLLSTDRSISEIAYAVGFSTPAYFSKCYRDLYGEAPSDIRNRI